MVIYQKSWKRNSQLEKRLNKINSTLFNSKMLWFMMKLVLNIFVPPSFPSSFPLSLSWLQKNDNTKWGFFFFLMRSFIFSILFHPGESYKDLQVWWAPSPGARQRVLSMSHAANSTSPKGESILELDVLPPQIFFQESWRTPSSQKTHKKICA